MNLIIIVAKNHAAIPKLRGMQKEYLKEYIQKISVSDILIK